MIVLLFFLLLFALFFAIWVFWTLGQPPVLSKKEIDIVETDQVSRGFEWIAQRMWDTTELPVVIKPSRPGFYALEHSGRLEAVLKGKADAKRGRPTV
jgi:hypothetical protein